MNSEVITIPTLAAEMTQLNFSFEQENYNMNLLL